MSDGHQVADLRMEEVSSSLRLRSIAQTDSYKAIQAKLAGVSSSVCIDCGKVTSIAEAKPCDVVECSYGL